MTNVDPNLRKAAVLLRSLDADTAAVMLGQLSAKEAATIRAAMRAVGQVAADEQADVVAELREARPAKQKAFSGIDVELTLSSSLTDESDYYHTATASLAGAVATSKRFEFLESSPIQALVPYLAREHAQTIAVVLSHLAPQRAAVILAALPHKVQSETVERLATLGDTDPECVSVVVRELEAWAAQRDSSRTNNGQRRDTMAAILSAADAKSRGQILSNMRDHKAALANQFLPRQPERTTSKAPAAEPHVKKSAPRIAEQSVRKL